MQTFLPYPDYEKSLRVLDYRRLGKQRAEVLGILRSFQMKPDQDKTLGFRDPCKWMWWGHFNQLVEYGIVSCREWKRRGYKDNTEDQIAFYKDFFSSNNELPFWFGDEKIHFTHQCVLKKKDPVFYGEVFPEADPSVGYIWPDCRHMIKWSK
jgi:hypothetical protein